MLNSASPSKDRKPFFLGVNSQSQIGQYMKVNRFNYGETIATDRELSNTKNPLGGESLGVTIKGANVTSERQLAILPAI